MNYFPSCSNPPAARWVQHPKNLSVWRFEATGGSVVCCCLSNYLFQGHQVTIPKHDMGALLWLNAGTLKKSAPLWWTCKVPRPWVLFCETMVVARTVAVQLLDTIVSVANSVILYSGYRRVLNSMMHFYNYIQEWKTFKEVGMACQKVCKHSKRKYKSEGSIQSFVHPHIFFSPVCSVEQKRSSRAITISLKWSVLWPTCSRVLI